jgi:hypothetical protein
MQCNCPVAAFRLSSLINVPVRKNINLIFHPTNAASDIGLELASHATPPAPSHRVNEAVDGRIKPASRRWRPCLLTTTSTVELSPGSLSRDNGSS